MTDTIVQKFHCGEIFVTDNLCMILECKTCKEQFGVYSKFLDHIFQNHYDNWTRPKSCMPTLERSTIIKKIEPTDNRDLSDDENLVTEQLEPIEDMIMEDDFTEGTSVQKSTAEGNLEGQRLSIKNAQSAAKRKYKCKICGFSVTGQHNLRGHIQRHSNIKPFTCLTCNKGFYTSTELNIHTRRHLGDKPYVCSFCGKDFVSAGTLTTHEKKHLGIRKHKCDQCEKSFFTPFQLRNHIVVHTQERNYSCEQCQAKFSRKRTLLTHMKLHENALEYECIICHMRFNQRPTLLWHVKSKHNVLREGSEGMDPSQSKAANNIN
ncbi:gastrula zinc finger protein XlCGF7.1 [Ceratitis capitata]|uniref:Zinc finger protein 45 n=1 Tax=Ceratitis capitata TaxID=7213 RepID=W8C5C4_CERCA|nr:gastrula zinc finger protein XlCGF7.1 [Ceratitis capitata]